MAENGKEVAVKEMGIKELIQGPMKKQFALALPKHLTPDRFVRVALTAINKVPKLLLCTKESLMACLMDCSQLGLEPDGRKAHLIPYGDKCTLIIDYKGLVALARRSGEIADIHADIVCKNDKFEYSFGSDSRLEHRPNIEDRGPVIAAYSFVRLKDGSSSYEVMNVKEIDAIKKRSKASNSGPWVTDWAEMAKKTVFRRHAKWLPMSAEFQEAIDKDYDIPADIVRDPADVPGKPEVAMPTAVEDASASEPIKELPAGGCTEDQQKEIEKLAQEKGENLPALLGGFGFEQVKQLPKKDADSLIGYLKNRKAKANA